MAPSAYRKLTRHDTKLINELANFPTSVMRTTVCFHSNKTRWTLRDKGK